MNYLRKTYEEVASEKLVEELGIKNKMTIPKITKVVVNMGIGEATKNKEIIKRASEDMARITGQKPSVRAAKISVAGFGLRAGMPVGLKVTLRGERMYSFLQKLFSIALPRLRDFRGVPVKSFDNAGNYTLGIEEHIIFPEVDMSQSSPRGMEVTIVMTSRDKEKSKRLLELMGMPFEKEE